MSESVSIQLVIVGAGGHGSELHSYVRDMRGAGANITLLGFVDEVRPAGVWGATRILGDFEALAELLRQRPGEQIRYITAIGDNEARQAFVSKVEGLGAPNLRAWTLCHPAAIVGDDVKIGEGTCISPGVVVTTRVAIGMHCILNVRSSVSHDCYLGDFVNVNPGAVLAGTVRAGRSSFIGAGATVIQRKKIGIGAIVGAGAVVIHDVPDHLTVVGVPARSVGIHPRDGRGTGSASQIGDGIARGALADSLTVER